MLTKEECLKALDILTKQNCCYCDFEDDECLCQCALEQMLKQLIEEHFKLVKENERLLFQLVECQRVCQLKQERINELEKGTVSYVD